MGMVIKLPKGEYILPTTVGEIELRTFIELIETVEQSIPQLWNDLLTASSKKAKDKIIAEIDDLYYSHEVMPYMARYVANHIGCTPMEIIGDKDNPSMHRDDLESMYWRIYKLYQGFVFDEDKLNFWFDGTNWSFERKGAETKEWTLPSKYMEKSTVGEFMLASQFQAANKELQNGTLSTLPKVMAVIFRPIDEEFDPGEEELIEERSELFLRTMKLDVALQCAFFLARLSESYAIDSGIYTVARQLGQYRRELMNM